MRLVLLLSYLFLNIDYVIEMTLSLFNFHKHWWNLQLVFVEPNRCNNKQLHEKCFNSATQLAIHKNN